MYACMCECLCVCVCDTFTCLPDPDKYLPTAELKKQIVQMEEDFVKVPVVLLRCC